MNKRLKKVIPFVLILSVTLGALIYFFVTSDLRLPDDYYSDSIKEISPGDKTVYIKVSCETILDNMEKLSQDVKDSGYVPEDGIILSKTEYVLEEGDSVFDLLLKATRHNKIHLDFSGNPDNPSGAVYVRGINHIYEYSCGPLSGWLFKINGKFSSSESSGHFLSDKDFVEWVYTCDLGRDVGSINFEDSVND